MTELAVPSIEDAVIRVSTAKELPDTVVVDTHRSTFLAYNTAFGYSQVDFARPSHRKIRELAALLSLHCDLHHTDHFYAGLYLDMMSLVSPATRLTFSKEVDTSPVPSSAPHFVPDSVQVAPTGTTLVAFGESNTYGTDLAEVEIGRDDAIYREARAYPRLLARHLGLHYGGNLAEPGRGNNRIMRRVCDFVANHRDELDRCFLVIGLTHPSRKIFMLKNGWEYLFINRHGVMEPRVLKPLCLELFLPEAPDPRQNEEFHHKFWVLSSFLSAVGCKHAIFPGWDFACSGGYFRHRELGRHGLFYFGQNQRCFGFHGLVRHLPMSSTYHPLSEGHALFAQALAESIRKQKLL